MEGEKKMKKKGKEEKRKKDKKKKASTLAFENQYGRSTSCGWASTIGTRGKKEKRKGKKEKRWGAEERKRAYFGARA